MIFESHEPKPPFDGLVESIFYFKNFERDHSIERGLPTGQVFVIFELDGMERQTCDNEMLKPIAGYRKAWISGMHQNYISISAHQQSEMFVIQFKAFGAHPFLHVPMEHLANKIVPGTDIYRGHGCTSWFWVASGLGLIWNLIGVVTYQLLGFSSCEQPSQNSQLGRCFLQKQCAMLCPLWCPNQDHLPSLKVTCRVQNPPFNVLRRHLNWPTHLSTPTNRRLRDSIAPIVDLRTLDA